jgi:3-phosphoshikimate 1-carboxyvinyltransferase
MDVTIVPSSDLFGQVNLPSSKSQTLRALYSALLAKGLSIIENPLSSEDTDAMVGVLEAFGAKVSFSCNKIFVISKGYKNLKKPRFLDVKNSGITLRFVSALIALMNVKITVSGSDSLKKQRSVKDLEAGLKILGAKVQSDRGFCPFSVSGPITKNKTWVYGKDSQPVSAVLWVLSLLNKKGTLHVLNADEKPWVNLTLSWLKYQNKKIINKDFKTFFIKGKPQVKPFKYKVASDFSSAAFILAAGLIAGKQIALKNLNFSDPQGDKAVFYHLKKAGAPIEFSHQEVIVSHARVLDLNKIDCSTFIDALPVLSTLACFSAMPCQIFNAQGARGKESDRISCMRKNLETLGIKVEEKEDGLIIHPALANEGVVDGFKDHRIIMALAVLALKAKGPVKIRGACDVKKTYPNFFKDLQNLGATVLWH